MNPSPAASWLEVSPGRAPLILSIPHSGTQIPNEIEMTLVNPWLARKDTDWWVQFLYGFAREMEVTVLRTALSRTVIDLNRDPGGVSLCPGQATTELCPTTTFDGEPLYAAGAVPTATQIAERRERYFDPYHVALAAEIERVRSEHGYVVVYDAHSVRSRVARLFAGELPQFNIGTNGGKSCSEVLAKAVQARCARSGYSHVTNGRFRGGYITRHYGRPDEGTHVLQMELACRGYLREPADALSSANWPPQFDPAYAAPLQIILRQLLSACLDFIPH